MALKCLFRRSQMVLIYHAFILQKKKEQKNSENILKIDEEKKSNYLCWIIFERKGITDFIEVARQLPEYQFIWFGDTLNVFYPKKISDN